MIVFQSIKCIIKNDIVRLDLNLSHIRLQYEEKINAIFRSNSD